MGFATLHQPLQLRSLTMNGFTLAILACAIATSSAFFYDPATATFTLGALSLNSGASLALTSGSTTVFLTSAGIVAAAVALLGGGGLRAKRSAPVEDLQNTDRYFSTISAMD